MPSPAQVSAGRFPASFTNDYYTDLNAGLLQGSAAPTIPTFTTIPAGSLTPWNTAKAKALAGTGSAIVWSLGASTAQGGSAVSNVITKSPIGQFKTAKLAAGYPTGGDFFLSTYTSDWSGNNAPNGWPFVTTPASTHPDSWSSAGPWWVPTYTPTAVSLTTPQMQIVSPTTDLGYTPGSARVYYMDLGNQDGGGSGTGFTFEYNTAASESGATTITLLGDNLIHTFDVTNLAGGTISLGHQSNAAAMAIIGVLFCPGNAISTTGIFYCRMGSPGFYMGDLANENNAYPADKISRFVGTNQSAAPFTPVASLSPILAPDLVCIDPLDDPVFIQPGTTTTAGQHPTVAITGFPADAYHYGLERMAQAFRRKASGCTVVHGLISVPDNRVYDTTISTTFVPQNWGYFLEAHRTIASRYNHIVDDINANWGELGVTYGYLTATNPHPNDAGAGTAAPTGNPPAYLNVQARVTRWLGIGL